VNSQSSPLIRCISLLLLLSALAACATNETKLPDEPQQATGISIKSEPAEMIGEVAAVFVTVDISTMGATIRHPPEALKTSGAPIQPMRYEEAIDKVGGEGNLTSKLDHMPSAIPFVGFSGVLAVGAVATLVYAPFAPFFLIKSLSEVSHDRLIYGLFGCFPGGNYWDCHGPTELKGYLFFPKAEYVTLQVTAVDSNFPKTSNIQQPARYLWR
jgi:hypothetical protein